MKDIRKFIKQTLSEYITPQDLKSVENYADNLFSDVGIDVEFTKHFLDRVNDLRNKQDITPEELKALYHKTYERYANAISKLPSGSERVLTDPSTNINVPFVLNWDGKSPDIDLINKTVMRKKDFKSYTPKLQLEEVDDDTLSRMSDFGMDESDIDENGYITLYHGGIELPDRLNSDEILFLTNDYATAEMYANIRGEQNKTEGEVFIIKAKPEDVNWNTGSGEIEFDRGGLISRRGGYLTIIPKTDENIDVPINVGDTVLGGKFKNKKIVVKDIDKNEKGDITINNKPLLRFRTVQEDFRPSKEFHDSVVTISDLYVEADNMLDAYSKSKNSIGPSSRSTNRPLTISKLLDGSLILLDGHHRIADAIKYLDKPTFKNIMNLKFKAIIHNEKYNSIEDMPSDFQYWMPFMDWADSTFSTVTK